MSPLNSKVLLSDHRAVYSAWCGRQHLGVGAEATCRQKCIEWENRYYLWASIM